MAPHGSQRLNPSWFLDEVAHAGRENLDSAHVARYDSKEDAAGSTEVALLRELGLTDQSTVLDIGAGTGQFTLAVARSCRRVIAVDVSPVMLGALRAKAQASGLRNIELVQAGFLSYEHLGERVDIAYSRFALHHLPDFWKTVALTRLHEMIRPGGVLRLSDVVYGFAPQEAEAFIEAWCSTGGAGAGVDQVWTRAELEEHVRDEHSTFTWILEPIIERSGFIIEQVEYTPDRIVARYVLRRT